MLCYLKIVVSIAFWQKSKLKVRVGMAANSNIEKKNVGMTNTNNANDHYLGLTLCQVLNLAPRRRVYLNFETTLQCRYWYLHCVCGKSTA